MTRIAPVVRFVIALALCLAGTAYAQTFCGPNGVNAYGMACDPNQLGGGGIGTQQPQGGVSPAQPTFGGGPGIPAQPQQPLGPPSISNRPPSGIPPTAAQSRVSVEGTLPIVRERNQFQDFVLQSLGRDLPMFGYNLFQNVPSTFAPVDRVPVTSDYVIGPGDEILIRAWGQVDIDYRVVVDRDGTINIPHVGNVNVAGIRFQDLHGYLRSAIGRVFRNFELSVSLGQLRSIQVFVVGNATRPGTYTVSSLSTLVNALFASGGPTTRGSMRRIQLKRGGGVVTEFDVYDLLLKGDKSRDARLLPGDVIYVPPIGQLTAISGSVNAPAIYELKGETTLGHLIELAGGLAITAAGQKVTVERISDRRTRQLEDFTLDRDGMTRAVRDGDLVQVLPLSPRFANAVTVRGNVAVPARHPWRVGMRVKDVIPDKDSLIIADYWIKRNLTVRPDLVRRDYYAPPAGDAPTGASDGRQGGSSAELRPGALSQERLRTEVKRNLSEVNWDYAVVERLNRDDLTTTLIPFNLGKAILEGDPRNNLVLEAGDVITVFSKDDIQVPVAKQTKFVRIEGEVATPGVYQVMPGETLRQLLARIGGFSPSAYLFGSEFTRDSVRALQQKRLDEALDRLAQEVERNAAAKTQSGLETDTPAAVAQQTESQRRLVERLRQVRAQGRIVLEVPPTSQADLRSVPELPLEDGDRFVIPAQPAIVTVVGAVYNQNSFIYDANKRVSDYLGQAGGTTREADSGRVYVVRADGSVTGRAGSSLFNPFGSEKLMPGDTIVVPENLDRFRLTKELKDWSQIFYQFALGVAGLKVLQGL